MRQSHSDKVTAAQISAVMAALGRRNRGKKKAMSPAERAQRQAAGRASAAIRRRRAALGSGAGRGPGVPPTPPPPGTGRTSTTGLAAKKDAQERDC